MQYVHPDTLDLLWRGKLRSLQEDYIRRVHGLDNLSTTQQHC